MYNFNAGPSALPKQVFQEAANAILNFNDSGLSLLEIGHRTKLWQPVMDEAAALVKDLMQLSDKHEVLFLHGGASTQFMQVPYNLLPSNGTAAYIDTGVWSSKAIKEAKLFGKVDVIASSAESNYDHIPTEFTVPQDASYLHITTNNTIYGTQYHNNIPYQTKVPLVADMSSDILSCARNFNEFALIYAGAQKNMGAAGVNLVVVNKEVLSKVDRKIPTILDYVQHIANGSMLNTPPVFAIYVLVLTLRWLKAQGGLLAIEKLNQQKADLLYNTIDANAIYKPTVQKYSRSQMNVCFVMDNEALEKEFLLESKQLNIVGIEGHRSVGGFRVSLYNAIDVPMVEYLCSFMADFAQRKG
jgi:phosphoserine aminotransferase